MPSDIYSYVHPYPIKTLLFMYFKNYLYQVNYTVDF